MADNQADFLDTEEAKFSQYFLKHDSLRTLDYELALTLNKRYKCVAGCRMCYLGSKWTTDEEFAPFADYTNKNLTPEWEHLFFEFAENYPVLSTIDDMRYLKKNFPIQYDFYKRNAEKFMLSSMSDQALFYHYDIMMNEMKFKDIYEISFSDKFVAHNRKKLEGMFKNIMKRYTLKHVKVITGNNGATDRDLKEVQKFFKFLRGNGIDTYHHHNVLKDWMRVEDAAHAVYSEGFGPFSVLNQVTFCAFDDLYMELKNFTPEENQFKIGSIYDLHDYSDILPMVLQAKLDTYRNNGKVLSNDDAHYVKYFRHCGDTFRVNHDFNFVPAPLLNSYPQWYERMVKNEDWIETDLGILKRDSVGVKSIIEVIK